VFEATFVCANTTIESVTPLFDWLIYYSLLEFSLSTSCFRNSTTSWSGAWYTGITPRYGNPQDFRLGLLAGYIAGLMN